MESSESQNNDDFEARIQHFVDQPWTITAGRTRERMLIDARRWFGPR